MTITRAIVNAFTKAAASSSNPSAGMSRIQLGAGSSMSSMFSGTNNNSLAQMGAYNNGGWLFSVVSRICEGMGSLEWDLYEGNPRDDSGDKLIYDHPLVNLWQRPNPFYTYSEFIETTQQHMELVGESWWVLNPPDGVPNAAPLEIWPVRPDRMQPIKDNDKFISGYLYTAPGAIERIPLSVDQVVFYKKPNPLDLYRGAGAVQSILVDLESERFAALWNRNFFYNEAEPGGVIEYDKRMSTAEWEQTLLRWREQHQGISNAHRVAIIEGGHWVDRKITQRDMQFPELRRATRDVVLGAFGFPVAMLGVSESVNRANAEAAEVMFSRWIIKPRAIRVGGVLNTKLVPLFGDNLYFRFKDPTPTDRDRDLKEAVAGYNSGLLTKNEGRKRLGEQPDPDGGDGYKVVTQPLTSSDGTDGNSTNIDTGKSLVIIDQIYKSTDEPLDPTLPSSIRRPHARMIDSWKRRFSSELDLIIHTLDTKGVASAVVKLESDDVDSVDWDWSGRYLSDVVDELRAVYVASFSDLAPELPMTQGEAAAIKWAREHGAMLLSETDDGSLVGVTRQRVRDILVDELENGNGTRQSLYRRLREDLAFSPARARNVGNTETTTALGQGSRSAAVAQGRDQKRWRTAGDENVCDICYANEGDWIDIDETFDSGDDTIPGHPGVCRCVVEYRTSRLHEDENGNVDTVTSNIAWREFRCPSCHKLISKRTVAGSLQWCRNCKQEHEVD